MSYEFFLISASINEYNANVDLSDQSKGIFIYKGGFY